MATTDTSTTDGKITMKDTTENKTDSRDERMKIHQVLFCSVVPFIIVACCLCCSHNGVH